MYYFISAVNIHYITSHSQPFRNLYSLFSVSIFLMKSVCMFHSRALVLRSYGKMKEFPLPNSGLVDDCVCLTIYQNFL
ncbi:hypothetical protein VNO80_08288 [Phaseolus coccineus]|uniref:Uncharacterized protein n=1 Tax=Phaseolus coccineus TaxID=3886 RepID=A0AAN9NLT4_PHACN